MCCSVGMVRNLTLQRNPGERVPSKSSAVLVRRTMQVRGMVEKVLWNSQMVPSACDISTVGQLYPSCKKNITNNVEIKKIKSKNKDETRKVTVVLFV